MIADYPREALLHGMTLFQSIVAQAVYVVVLEKFASFDFISCPTSSYEESILLIREKVHFVYRV